MAETAEEISKREDVRQALDQTTGAKVKIKAQAKDKFWFVTHVLVLIGCSVLYYAVGSKFIPLPPAQVDLTFRMSARLGVT